MGSEGEVWGDEEVEEAEGVKGGEEVEEFVPQAPGEPCASAILPIRTIFIFMTLPVKKQGLRVPGAKSRYPLYRPTKAEAAAIRKGRIAYMRGEFTTLKQLQSLKKYASR